MELCVLEVKEGNETNERIIYREIENFLKNFTSSLFNFLFFSRLFISFVMQIQKSNFNYFVFH